MKKIKISAFVCAVLLATAHLSGQEKVQLQKYDYVTNGDTNMYQGIPSIGFPLFNLDVPTAGISINLSLNYTTESASAYSLISDTGKGWNLSPIGSIVRSKTRQDKDFIENSAISDVYYYNYPGGSGRFYIGKNASTNELIGVHTSPSNDRIIINRDNSQPGKVKSFMIIDTKGNRYMFDKVNVSIMKNYMNFGTSVTKLINSGFFLSAIYNEKNQEVAHMEYETTTELVNPAIGYIQQQKIQKITVNGKGSVEYFYLPNSEPHKVENPVRDWYQLGKIVLKDTKGHVMNQYQFVPADNSLGMLVNLDKNDQIVQKFSFEYNTNYYSGYSYTDVFGYPDFHDPCSLDEGEFRSPGSTNRNTVTNGILKRVILPTGGVTEYEFESNAVAKTVPDAECSGQCFYDNYDFEKIYMLNFDTKIAEYYTVPLPSGYKNRVFVTYDYLLYASPPHKPGVPDNIEYYIENGQGDPVVNPYNGFECGSRYFEYSPGNSINIFFSGARKGHGTLSFYAAKEQARDENEYGYGLRIKSIKNFNPSQADPVSHIRYRYEDFTDARRSSGEVLDLSSAIDYVDNRSSNQIGYKNIKVSNMIDGSFARYHFVPQIELTTGNTSSFAMLDQDMSTYLRSAGLLRRKEEYGSTGEMLQKTEMTYDLKDVVIPDIMNGTVPVKKINISKQSSTTESYVSGTAKKLVASSETVFEDTYNNVSSTKETLADGTVTEKIFLYPADKGIQKLLTANMVNIPLETTVTRNGKPVGRAETKFDDPAHLYPTSVIAYNMQAQAPVTATRMEVYDSKGNLVQTRGKNGIPVTTLWGYYQTQPIAVIAGAAYADIASLPSVTAAVNASNADHDDPATEPQLVTVLENLRKDPALQEYTVTCTTYDPMAGVTNSISANGIRTVNIYDASNRLIRVTDAAGKTLQEYQYHYKN